MFWEKKHDWEQSWYRHLTFGHDVGIMDVSCGCDAVVAYLLPKQTVMGSSPITRFARETLLLPWLGAKRDLALFFWVRSK